MNYYNYKPANWFKYAFVFALFDLFLLIISVALQECKGLVTRVLKSILTTSAQGDESPQKAQSGPKSNSLSDVGLSHIGDPLRVLARAGLDLLSFGLNRYYIFCLRE